MKKNSSLWRPSGDRKRSKVLRRNEPGMIFSFISRYIILPRWKRSATFQLVDVDADDDGNWPSQKSPKDNRAHPEGYEFPEFSRIVNPDIQTYNGDGGHG